MDAKTAAKAMALLSKRAAHIEELEAQLAIALAALKDCEEQLNTYAHHEYPGDHPVDVRRRQRDIEGNSATLALSEIAKLKEE